MTNEKTISREEQLEILSRVAAVADSMNKIEVLLDKGRKGEFKDKKGLFSNEGYPENVVFVLPDIVKDYDVLLNNSSLPFLEFVARFETWVIRLALAITLNKPHLHNKAVMAHMEKILNTCRIVEIATKKYFGGGDPEETPA